VSHDDATLKLRDAIEAFAADRAPELVAEARAEAVAKARTMLAEAMAESLLAHSAGMLRSAAPPVPRTAPARRAAAKRPATRSVEPTAPKPTPDQTRQDADSPPAQTVSPPDESELGYYVYGVVFARDGIPHDLAGVDFRYPAALVEEQGLGAIVSRVSLDEFGEERLRGNLNDVAWLEDKARAHEDVLDAALQHATVVPMRLCTIYSSEKQVREMLDRERALLLDALERLEGKAEWGVKLIAEQHALERAAATRASSDPEQDAASRGTAYMNRKRREARIREEEDQVAEEWGRTVHERLAKAASEALLNPVQRPEVGGYEGDMLLNGVYLVDDGEVEEFRAMVERLADEYQALGVTVELTGPWPPYNFVKSSIEAAR
jgi:hypothetical protein